MNASPEFPLTARPLPLFLYALVIFLSAFLLFELQPLIAKQILPWFGGSAGVWTTCMLFFQLALLAGYAYAHQVANGAFRRFPRAVHRSLLVLSILFLPAVPSSWWKPVDGSFPLWRILGLLAFTIGLPYFLLSATSPLLQTWYSRSRASGAPYRLFALSNLGSMLALLSYPTLLEPHVSLRLQANLWSGAYVVFAGLCFFLARDASHQKHDSTRADDNTPDAFDLLPPGKRVRVSWLLLAACASGLLLAVTNHLQNVAAVPFLWVLPLCVYLLSFILTFDHSWWYNRRIFRGLFAVSVASMAYATAGATVITDLHILIPLFLCGLFICCMVCHGELVRMKPKPQFLTSFYLTISLGGAIGGLFVAAVAPHLFPGLWELPILLIATPALILALALTQVPSGRGRQEYARSQFWAVWILSALGLIGLAGYQVKAQYSFVSDARLLRRNFYGTLRVTDDDELELRELANGAINHGEQFLDPLRRREPITYYGARTGVGFLMSALQKRGPVRIGIIGLGTGTMAAWLRHGDYGRFYEINPLVLQVARTQFTYLRDCRARTDVILGDARLSLEREPAQQFDALIVDAFSADSIPVHLLTREAWQIYFRHLQHDGILAVHVSNKYLTLSPAVAALATQFGKEAHLIESEKNQDTQTFASDWVLVGFDESRRFPWLEDAEGEIDLKPGLRPWTDDWSNLWQALR